MLYVFGYYPSSTNKVPAFQLPSTQSLQPQIYQHDIPSRISPQQQSTLTMSTALISTTTLSSPNPPAKVKSSSGKSTDSTLNGNTKQ